MTRTEQEYLEYLGFLAELQVEAEQELKAFVQHREELGLPISAERIA